MPVVHAKKRILIVDDHPLMRRGVTGLINAEKDLMVCGEAGDEPTALRLLGTLHPDLAIVDIVLGHRDGIELTEEIRVRHPGLPVLILSLHQENLYAARALAAGARGYLMKSVATELVLVAIRRVLAGHIYVSEAVADTLMLRTEAGLNHGSSVAPLSNRELQVLRRIGAGHGPSGIADELRVSVKAVEYYADRIKVKLNLVSAEDLRVYAVEWFHCNPAR